MADITITEGDTLEVDYTLENTGDGTGTFDPRLLVQGVQEDQDTGITLDPTQTATGTLSWPTESGDAVTDALAETVTDDTSDSITVTVEGGIPDSGDLQAAYDFSLEDGTLPVQDQSENGYDLNTGQFTGVSVSINGVQAGEFDGNDDIVGTTFSMVSQPFTIAAAYEPIFLDSSIFDRVLGGAGTDTGDIYHDNTTGQELSVNAGTNLNSTTATAAGDVLVVAAVLDGSNSILRLNGSEIATGDGGTNGLDGVGIGATDLSNPFDFANVKMGEALYYPIDKSANIGEIEQYLIDKWGPTP